MTKEERWDRYLTVVKWASKRYRSADARLIIERGGIPSEFTRVERLAWDKYIN